MEEIKLLQFREKLELLGYSQRVINDYPASLQLFFRYLEEGEDIHSLEDVEPEHFTGYHTYLQYNKFKNDKYLSTVTIRSRLQCIKTFYSIMHSEKLIDKDYSHEIQLPKRHKSLPKFVPSEKDMKELINSVVPKDPLTTRDRAILELLYATGIRNKELRTLTVNNYSRTDKTLFITGKGSKDRVVPVGDWVTPYLFEYMETARPRLLNRHEPTDLLFLSKNGRMITNSNLGGIIKKYVKRIGLDKPFTPHCFRHACATHLLKAGADIRYIQELLGHADLSATQIYTKIDISFLKEAHKKYHPRESIDEQES